MAKKPHELIELVKPWGIAETTKKLMAEYLAKSGKVVDIDSWIRDRRTAAQFAEQMLSYWAVEDAFAEWFESNLRRKYPKVLVRLAGTDKDRRIVQGQSPRGRVTGEPDYLVDLVDGTKPIPVEFQFGAVELDAYDVKKNKVNKAEKSGGIILFAFLPQQQFTLMKPEFIKKHGEVKISSRLGGKETWNILTTKIIFKPKDYQITKADLLKGFR